MKRATSFSFALTLAIAAAPLHALGAPPPKAASPASEAAADESAPARAGKLRTQGNQAMLEMHYRDALALYEQARELAPDDVSLLYSIARAHELLGEFPQALESLERFVRDAPPAMKAKVGDVSALLKQLAARVSTLSLTCNVSGARVLLGDRVLGTTPLPESLRVPAGAATLQVELEGFFTQRKDVVLPGDGKLVLTMELLRKSTSGTVAVATAPLGASIFVDGKLTGTSSPKVELVLPAGEHRVVAQHEGYDDAIVPLVISPGSSRDVSVVLEKSVPLTSRWWFWTAAGVVVAGGAALTVALLTEKGPKQGSLSPGQVSAPLVRF